MDENERQKRLIEEEEETHAQKEENNIIEQTSDGISNNDEIDPAVEEIQETVIMENKDHNEEEFDETSKHIIEQLPERIRNKLTDDQLYIHLSLFIKFDADGSGQVDSNELESMLNELGFGDTTQDDCKAMIEELDADNTGNISFEEFNDLLVGLMYDEEEEADDDEAERENAALVLQKQFRNYLSTKEIISNEQGGEENNLIKHDDKESGEIASSNSTFENSVIVPNKISKLQLKKQLLPCDNYNEEIITSSKE